MIFLQGARNLKLRHCFKREDSPEEGYRTGFLAVLILTNCAWQLSVSLAIPPRVVAVSGNGFAGKKTMIYV